jgi:hypothetical protein
VVSDADRWRLEHRAWNQQPVTGREDEDDEMVHSGIDGHAAGGTFSLCVSKCMHVCLCVCVCVLCVCVCVFVCVCRIIQ